MTAAPALGAPVAPKKSAPAPQAAPRAGGIDVVIVGAGAAGIAAARRLAAAGRRVALFEAAATVLIRPARRLHNPVESQIRENDDLAHSKPPWCCGQRVPAFHPLHERLRAKSTER